MEMPTIQELYGNLEEHELELKRYGNNGDEKKKRSLPLKAINFFDEEEEEFDEGETKYEEDEKTPLIKKF